MPITPDDLTVDFFPQAGFAAPHDRSIAWDVCRSAVRALAQLDSGESPDRSMHWNHVDAGWLASTSGPTGEVIGWFDFGAASIWIERRHPQEGAWIELAGKQRSEASAWVTRTADMLAGSRQPRVSEHDRETSAYPEPPSEALADLEAIYEGAGLMLNALAEAAAHAGLGIATPQLDTDSLKASVGIGTRIIGFDPGLDQTLEPHWFVRTATIEAQLQVQYHTLPLTDITRLDTGDAQHARIAQFIAQHVNP